MFCRVRPLLPEEGCNTEGKIISYPTSMEASGRGVELAQNGIFCDDVASVVVFVFLIGVYACFSLFI